MPLDLVISGPGFDARCSLAPGEPALAIGRDADCPICLPDPLRNISRRHLSVWNAGELLQFEVVSAHNAVAVDGIEFPPGARGSLAPGQMLALAGYQVSVVPSVVPQAMAAATGDDTASDPWAQFEKEAAQLVASVSATQPVEEDPFGEWGFQSTFLPNVPADEPPAPAAGAGLAAFFAGLGLGGAPADDFTRGELEAMGRLTRIALQGLLQAVQATGGTRQPAGPDDRTTLEPREVNPLRMDTPLESKLWYLFGGQAAAAGCIPPDRAVGELVAQLLAHEQAMGEALRQAIEGVVEDFSPEALKSRLLPGGSKLFESGRAWEAFVREYTEQGKDRHARIRQLLDRHFAAAYAQALLRAKRHTGGPPRG